MGNGMYGVRFCAGDGSYTPLCLEYKDEHYAQRMVSYLNGGLRPGLEKEFGEALALYRLRGH